MEHIEKHIEKSLLIDSFLRYIFEGKSVSYHPDTEFADYIDKDGKKVFNEYEAALFDDLNAYLNCEELQEKACHILMSY